MPPKAAEPTFKPHPRIEHLLRKATQGNDLSRREDYTRAGLVIVEEVVDTNGNKTSRVPETATEVAEEKRPGFKWYEADSVEDAGKHVGGADYFAVISGVQKQRKKHDRAETGVGQDMHTPWGWVFQRGPGADILDLEERLDAFEEECAPQRSPWYL
ncbi:hypothetical protein PG987_013606 [Apiospora arundinis]